MRNERALLSLLPLSLMVGAFGIISSVWGGCGGTSGGGTGASAGAGGTTAAGGDCYDYASFDGGSTTVSFATDVLPIWRNSCGLSTSCHGNPDPTVPGQHYYGPASSSPAPSAAQITQILMGTVGVASIDEPDMDVVKAGDPAHSFMMYKLDGDPTNITSGVSCSKLQCATASPNTCQLSMPQGGPELPAAQRDTIRSWIAQGALDN